MDFSFYGTLDEAEQYFSMRLHSPAWCEADPSDKPKALYAATTYIDRLNFKGHRHTVWQILQTLPHRYDPNDPFLDTWLWREREAQVRAAELQQPLEFPRDADTTTPDDIRRACYEIAYALLDGRDPEMDLENLQVTAHGYGEVRTHYERSQVPQEHLLNFIPSAVAFNLLRPFLRDANSMRLTRI